MEGATVRIINNTNHTLKLDHIHSYQMNTWDSSFPTEIPPGNKDVYIEWDDTAGKTLDDDGGEARYMIKEGHYVEIQANGRDEGGISYRHLNLVTTDGSISVTVDWGWKINRIFVFNIKGQ